MSPINGDHMAANIGTNTSLQSVVPLWINGKEKLSSSAFDVISPLTSRVCWQAASAGDEDVTQAIEAAQAAFPTWSKTKPVTRQNILLKAAELLEANADEYASFMRTEMGAELTVAAHFVVPLSIAMLRDIASRVPTVCGIMPVCQGDVTSAIVYKEPYGVILGIVPWYGNSYL